MMDRPSAAELLEIIAETLTDVVLPDSPGHTKHAVRIAANLSRILGREAEFGAAIDDQHRHELAALLGADTEPLPTIDLVTALIDRLGANPPHDIALEQSAWRLASTMASDKLSVARPGYDAHDAAAEFA